MLHYGLDAIVRFRCQNIKINQNFEEEWIKTVRNVKKLDIIDKKPTQTKIFDNLNLDFAIG